MQIPAFLDEQLRGVYRQQLVSGDPSADTQLNVLVRQIQVDLTPGLWRM
jgi:hypothetical protein